MEGKMITLLKLGKSLLLQPKVNFTQAYKMFMSWSYSYHLFIISRPLNPIIIAITCIIIMRNKDKEISKCSQYVLIVADTYTFPTTLPLLICYEIT